jgi:hypothetical protein
VELGILQDDNRSLTMPKRVPSSSTTGTTTADLVFRQDRGEFTHSGFGSDRDHVGLHDVAHGEFAHVQLVHEGPHT